MLMSFLALFLFLIHFFSLDHDVKGLEEVPNLCQDILEALNKESEGPKPNIAKIEVINLAEEGEKEKPVKIGVNFPKDMKDELKALLKEFKEIFAWSYKICQDWIQRLLSIGFQLDPNDPQCGKLSEG